MFIGEASFKGSLIMVSRDVNGKFFISKNGQRVGVRLNASEMCRWFLASMHEEPSNKMLSDEELKIKTKEIYDSQHIITAIKFVREQREWGLKQAKDYVESLR